MSIKQKLNPKLVNGIPEIAPEELQAHLGDIKIVDVRQPDEFYGELSHIPGALLITLGPELDSFFKSHDKNEEIVFVCRGGARSGRAASQGLEQGFAKCVSLQGGMSLWNEKKLPVEKNK